MNKLKEALQCEKDIEGNLRQQVQCTQQDVQHQLAENAKLTEHLEIAEQRLAGTRKGYMDRGLQIEERDEIIVGLQKEVSF